MFTKKEKTLVPPSDVEAIERAFFLSTFSAMQALTCMRSFMGQNTKDDSTINQFSIMWNSRHEEPENIYHLLKTEISANQQDLRQSENALSVLAKHSPDQFIQWLENTDEQVRRVAIETLGQFSNLLGDKINQVQKIVGKRIHHCREFGRFRELHKLLELWEKIIGASHEMSDFANEMNAFLVKKKISDDEIETYIQIIKTVAEENNINITPLIFLLSDGESQWLNYCIELPDESYEIEKIFELNSHLVSQTVKKTIPLKIKQNVVIMFK